jgi:hypothetical protein
VIVLNSGLIKTNWDDVEKFTHEEISYFLSLEGKSTDAICKIRSLSKEEVQRHLIEGKIKYRYLARANSVDELFQTLCSLPKNDKLILLTGLKSDMKQSLLEYIKTEYMNMQTKNKETAIWILGELKSVNSMHVLQKAVVHKHVNIRRMAVSALGKLGDIASENALIRALDDENSQVVHYAVKSLIKIKSKKALEKIKSIYIKTDKEYLKRASEEYLSSLEEWS